MKSKAEFIELVLLNRRQLEKAIKQKRRDPSHAMKDPTLRGKHSDRSVSDPTAAEAIRNLDPLDVVYLPYGARVDGRQTDFHAVYQPERWASVAMSTERYFTVRQPYASARNFYHARYVLGEHWRVTCAKMGFRRSQYFSLRWIVILTAANYAVSCGILSPTWQIDEAQYVPPKHEGDTDV